MCKKQVSSSIMEDMEKYIDGFNPDNYEVGDSTESSVIEYVRSYYDNHLPVDVTAWIRVNQPVPELIYGKQLISQICFVRGKINWLLRSTYDEWDANKPQVVSTHYSKSVKLPVYKIDLEKYGIEIVLRYNFFEWIVSIKSEKPLDCDFLGLFDPKKEIPVTNCYGVPLNMIFGSYEKNHSQFMIEFSSEYDVYTFFFILKNYLGIEKED